MRRHVDNLQSKRSLAAMLSAFCLVVLAIPLFSCVRARPATSITINNSSNWEIKHVYLSSTTQDNWGPDQLNGSSIGSGGSHTLSNVACDGSDIKVISEDQNGCFLSTVVACASDSTWTITNTATPDCGN
jgi:hypothetical protein